MNAPCHDANANRSGPEVLRSLQRDHDNLTKLLDAFARQLEVFDQGEHPDYDIVEGVLDYCLTYPDLYHHPKEDLVYRKLMAVDPGAVEDLKDLEYEHEELGNLTRRLAEVVHNVLQDLEVPREAFDIQARNFLDAYRRHMEMEDRYFFPAALRALSPADWDEIATQAVDREDPLFGDEADKRFELLRDDILSWAADGA
jgi:hemerythrin-like domain-containing protein